MDLKLTKVIGKINKWMTVFDKKDINLTSLIKRGYLHILCRGFNR